MADLINAVKTGSEESLTEVLARATPAQVNATDEGGATPLIWAVRGAKLSALHALLDRGADASAADAEGLSALRWAARLGLLDVAAALAERAPPQLHAAGSDGTTALHWAAHEGRLEVVVWLLAKGANARAEASGRKLPLHFAMAAGKPAVMEPLLEAMTGPDMDALIATAVTESGAADRMHVIPPLLKEVGKRNPDSLPQLFDQLGDKAAPAAAAVAAAWLHDTRALDDAVHEATREAQELAATKVAARQLLLSASAAIKHIERQQAAAAACQAAPQAVPQAAAAASAAASLAAAAACQAAPQAASHAAAAACQASATAAAAPTATAAPK